MKAALVLFISVFSIFWSYGQSNVTEEVYAHLSSHDLIVGETLYFNNYVFSRRSGKLSNLSRLLYVELLNESGKPVYQTKIHLNQGVGNGSYYIPTNLETGNYHFVAYTRWMKNFNQYFRQPIVIINPYLNSERNSTYTPKVKVNFSTEGGNFLAGVKNRMVVRVTDQYDNGLEVSGKIVSKNGSEAIPIKTDVFGLFDFFITPQLGEEYQFILENEEGFEFYDLPKTCVECSMLKIVDLEDLFVMKVAFGNKDEFFQTNLRIFNNLDTAFSGSMAVNTSLSVAKKELPEGLLRVVLSSEQGEINERLIWNGSVATKESAYLGSFSSLSEVSASFSISDTSNLSVSVEQVYGESIEVGVSYGRIDKKIDLNLPANFYSSLDSKMLESVLIASNGSGGQIIPTEVNYLPEYRFGIVQGTVLNENKQPVSDLPVGLVFSGLQPQMSVATTDASGNFLLTYDPLVLGAEPYVDVLDDTGKYMIQVEPEFYMEYPKFDMLPVLFDSVRVAKVIKRSIFNQIDNAYSQVLSDESKNNSSPQFYGFKSYQLADYTRFNTMRDTFIELIVEVGVSKNENNFDFNLRSKDLANGMIVEQPTLLLLDGSFVSSEEVMNLSPYLVDHIDVLSRRYYFGRIIFDGIISIHTVSSDRGEIEPKGLQLDLVSAQTTRSNELESVDPGNSRVPYFQDLLLWKPSVYHLGGKLNLNFFSSEVKGLFEIRIEGISKVGAPISERAYFEVK